LKPLLLVTSIAATLALGVAAPAGAAAPCWKQLINDWYDGKIDHVYAPACYTEAIDHLPQDVSTYSSAKDDIKRAMLDALKSGGGKGKGGGNGGTTTTSTGGGGGGGGNGGSGGSSGGSEGAHKGVITRAIEWLGPANAASVPLPLLILAGVAFLLLAAAGGSFVNRRWRERRSPPPTA
jgi:hypothetical protein